MLKLVVEEKDRVVQAASIPVRWCIGKETLEELKNKRAINPYLLIVTVADGKEMTRQLEKLENMMTYVQFARPGKNRIFATIVWVSSGKYGDLWDVYFRRTEGRYNTDVIRYDGFPFPPRGCQLETAEIGVMVPEELFAKKPPAWENQWVNLWYSGMAKDQCEYRQRRLVAYTLQPIWFALRFMAGVIAIILTLLCWKGGLNFKLLVSPYCDLADIWRDTSRSIFKRDWVDDNWKTRRLFVFLPLAPIFWLCLFASFCGVSYMVKGFVEWDIAAVATVLVVVLLVVIGGLIDGARAIFYLIGKYLGKKGIQRLEKRLKEELAFKYEGLEPLICDGAELKAEIGDLPPERRTINLRFLDLKAKVCKPFAR